MSGGLIESAQSFVAGLLDLSRTRFELFGTELREELAHLATAVIGGLAVLVLAALGLAFGGLALIFYVSEANRLATAIGVALFFLIAAGVVAWILHRVVDTKAPAFDATIAELRSDLKAIKE
jgi:uncharacterized membrane protein YqjE